MTPENQLPDFTAPRGDDQRSKSSDGRGPNGPGCIADLLGPLATRPGFNGCPCPACQAEHLDALQIAATPATDWKSAAAHDKED